jgi:hypothetical protein
VPLIKRSRAATWTFHECSPRPKFRRLTTGGHADMQGHGHAGTNCLLGALAIYLHDYKARRRRKCQKQPSVCFTT